MTRYFRRTEPGARETLGAGLVAAGLAATVAAVSFYMVRLFLTREPMEAPEALEPGHPEDSRREPAV
ncbi:hypothetical protein ACFL3S_08580 [Gemmatimonadota bacterium]